jgi:hypothetical protein
VPRERGDRAAPVRAGQKPQPLPDDGRPVQFFSCRLGSLPREELCTRESLERVLPAVRRELARWRNSEEHWQRKQAEGYEPRWRDLVARFGLEL